MLRAKNNGSSEPKRRSRNGCWPCKSRKVKCGEEHPSCQNCLKTGDTCDYRIRLNWEGRRIKRRNAEDVGSDEAFSSQMLFSNIFLVGSPASADAFGVPLQRYATMPSSTNTGPKQYEFEHTLFQDLHQNSSVDSDVGAKKKKAKSMDGPYTSARSATATTFIANSAARARRGSVQHYLDLRSPASTISTSEEIYASYGQNDEQTDRFCLDQAQSPGHGQWSSVWGTGAALNSAASGSPQLSHVPSCVGDELACHKSWAEFGAVETADRNLCIDEGGDRPLGCRSLLPYAPQTGQGGDQFRTVWQNSDQPWMSEKSDTASTLMGAGSFEQAKLERQQPLWVANSNRKHIFESLPRGTSFLPDKLKDETNMRFFDHFVNHTAKVMAPFHSTETNPFSTFLPAVAFRSEILMSLMLAFAASHRAQVLRITEPELRIAEWANDIFPKLRLKLSDQSKAVPDDVLAAMVLLTSLEKSSPNAFGHSIPWQKHLSLTRSLMDKRIGASHVLDESDEEFAFIWSFFSYLDTMGQMSTRDSAGGVPYQTGPFDLAARVVVADEDEFDCAMGFTTQCGRLLVELAAQIRRCGSGDATTEQAVDASTFEAALELERRFRESIKKPLKMCRHIRRNRVDMRDLTEMDAASEAFHWAGIVCLRRRILRKPSSDEEIQNGVQRIWECIKHIRREREADTACVFPLFVAGCETTDAAQRRVILARFKSAEKSGMNQVKSARKLMEASWRENLPWHDLMQGEFLG